MKSRTGLLVAILLILCHSASGKADRVISITTLEHREGNTATPYRVQGKTVGAGPTFYYTLVCESGAAHLEVGHHYKAEAYGTKTLLIFLSVKDTPTLTRIEGIECDVESEKTTANQPQKMNDSDPYR